MAPSLPRASRSVAARTISHHSKSFALAAKLLRARVRDDASMLYAWCRRADDAVDLAPPAQQRQWLHALSAELEAVYAGRSLRDPVLVGFQQVIERRRIPASYPKELLAGLAMDVAGTGYRTLGELYRYCFRVAGTVGLMMCHVMGVRRHAALVHASHLGIAMQLTNVCRDVLEDWERHRLYLPDQLLASAGAPELRDQLGRPFPTLARRPVARVMRVLLDRAELYYRSGDAGLRDLPLRCAFGVRAARLIYAGIGRELRDRDHDPFAGRAVVSQTRKLALASRAAGHTLARLPVWLFTTPLAIPDRELRFSDTGVIL